MTNALTTSAPRAVAVDVNDPVAIYLDSEVFSQLQRVAKLMSSASLAPAHLRGEGKIGDCFLVAAQAFRWRMDPFSVAQHTYVLSGKLGYEGKLIAAVVNSSGRLQGSLDYRYSGVGDQRTVRVSGKLLSDTAAREITGSVGGWKTSNEQWKKNPDQMLAYRGAREWARRYMPEAVLGIQAEDDLAPTRNVTMRDITPTDTAPVAAVSAILDQISQEAESAATAGSDADPSTPPQRLDSAPTVAPPELPPELPPDLRDRARAIVTAIRAAKEVKDLDRIMSAQRGTLDAIQAVSEEAHNTILAEASKRAAEIVE